MLATTTHNHFYKNMWGFLLQGCHGSHAHCPPYTHEFKFCIPSWRYCLESCGYFGTEVHSEAVFKGSISFPICMQGVPTACSRPCHAFPIMMGWNHRPKQMSLPLSCFCQVLGHSDEKTRHTLVPGNKASLNNDRTVPVQPEVWNSQGPKRVILHQMAVIHFDF